MTRSAILDRSDVARYPKEGVERAFMEYWSSLQFQDWTGAAAFYDPRLRDLIGQSRLIGALAHQAPAWPRLRPVIYRVARHGEVTTLRYRLTFEDGQTLPAFIQWQVDDGNWQIVFDSQLDFELRTYVEEELDSQGGEEAARLQTRFLRSINDPPVLNADAASPLAYAKGDAAVFVDSGLGVSDRDDTELEGATVRISTGFQSGDDLVFSDQDGISGSYAVQTGILTLSGTATIGKYQAALRSVRFQSSSNRPVAAKTFEFKATDGDVSSAPATRNLIPS